MEHNECNNEQECNDNQNTQSIGFGNVLSKIKALKQQKKEKKQTLSTSSPSANKFSLSHYNTTPILNDTKLKKLLQMLEPNYNSFTFNKLFLNNNSHNTTKSSALTKYTSLFRDLSNYNDSKPDKEISRNIFSFKNKVTRTMTPLFAKQPLTPHKRSTTNNTATHDLSKLRINNSTSLNLSNIKPTYTNKYATIYNDAYYSNRVNNLDNKLNSIIPVIAGTKVKSSTPALKPKTLSSMLLLSNRNRCNYIIREQNNFKSISH